MDDERREGFQWGPGFERQRVKGFGEVLGIVAGKQKGEGLEME